MNNENVPMFTMITTYISYLMLIVIGHLRDRISKLLYPEKYAHLRRKGKFQPIYTGFESFFTRRMYTRIRDCWNRPINGIPGRIINVLERRSNDYNVTFELTGKTLKLINFGSYNYLGFSECSGKILDSILEINKNFPLNYSATTSDVGSNKIVEELEYEMADFLHKEDCIVFPMGFGTNSANIPVIMDQGTLIISDELNHTSIICGARMSEAVVKTFSHNDVNDLESVLRYQISQGQPVTHKAWRKIFVIVEGLYSMEGTFVKLKEIVELKKKYKFYIFIDEAHSIGAIGKTGRGVCEYLGVGFDDIDILMGTFTKSFGSSGGYIASSKDLISYLRVYSDFSLYGEQMSPIVAYKSLQVLKYLKYSGKGPELTARLYENSVFFRKKLKEMGFVLFGDVGSPIIPLMIYNPGKIGEFSRLSLERGLAVVVVGYPATPVISSRVRFCLSAAHTNDDLEGALRVIEYVGSTLGMDHLKKKKK